MEKQRTKTSFIEFANNPPAIIHQGQLIEKTAISKLHGMEGFAKELARLKTAAIESTEREKAIERDREIHSRLVKFLDSIIIEQGKIEDGKDSRFLLNICNTHPNMTYAIMNGKVFKDLGYLMEKNQYAIRDLFEFLADTKNIKRIKKCPYCDDFFIAKHTARKFCYPPKDCGKINKNKWQRSFMRKKRDKKSPDFDPDYV